MLNLRERYQWFADTARTLTRTQILQVAEVTAKIPNASRVYMAEIDGIALGMLDGWPSHHFYERWLQVPRLRRGQWKSFDVALYHDGTLCGLCFATAKRSKRRIKLVLLEGCPDPGHPLKGFVAAFMILAVENYAKMIDIPQILIPDPIPGAVPHYLKLGFVYDSDGQLVKGV